MPTRFPFTPMTAMLLLLVYYLAGRLGLSMAFVNTSATAVWPPTGIALAAMLLWGYRLWPVILAGAFLVNITTSGSFPASVMIAVGNTLEGLVGAYLVTTFADGLHTFDRASNLVKFALFAALIATAVSATLGVSSLVITGLAGWKDFGAIWLTWWLGDATGALIVTPLITLWARDVRFHWNGVKIVEELLLILSMTVLGVVLFGAASPFAREKYPLEFLTLVPVIWAAFRFGQREVSLLMVVLASIAVAGTLNGVGPFSRPSENESLLLLQAYVAIVTLTGLTLAAVVQAKKVADLFIRESEQRNRWLATIVESSDDAILSKTLDGIILSWNDGAQQIYGYTAAEMIGRSVSVLVPPENLDEFNTMMSALRRGEHITHHETVRIRKDGARIHISLTISPIVDSSGKVHGASTIGRDITERRQMDDRIRFQAEHDALTGLPNRMLCYDRIDQAIMHAARHR